jgi:hypothetical protein
MPWRNAEELRAIAQRLRAFARRTTDAEVRSELRAMITELERRAREQENGGSTEFAQLAVTVAHGHSSRIYERGQFY